MSSTGNTYPGTGATVSRTSATDWTNPGNIVSDNTTDATCADSGGFGSYYLVAKGFGFSVPTGATILGITVRVEASEHSASTEILKASLQNDTGTLFGDIKTADEGNISGTTKAVYTYGSTSDLWGASLTAAIVNDADFGVRLWFETTHDVRIDYVTLAVEYTVYGVLTKTLDSVTLSAAGTVSTSASGTLTSTLANVTLSSASTLAIAGAASPTLGALTLSGAGALAIAGSASPTLEALTLSAAGTVSTATGTLYYVVGPSAGWANPSASEVKAGQLSGGGPATASGSEASPTETGVFTFTSPASGLTAATAYRIAFVWSDGSNNSNVAVSDEWSTTSAATEAAASITLGDATLSSAGVLAISGTLTTTLGDVTLSSASALAITGTLAQTLGDVTLASTAQVMSAGTGYASITLGDVTLSSSATLPISGTLTKTLDAVSLSSAGVLAISGTLSKTLDAATLSSAGTTATVTTGEAAITLGSATLSSTGTLAIAGTVAKTLGDATLSSTGTLAIAGQASVTLGDVTSSATGAVAIAGVSGITLGDLTVNAAIMLVTPDTRIGTASITLGDVTLATMTAPLLTRLGNRRVREGTLRLKRGDLPASGLIAKGGTKALRLAKRGVPRIY